MAALGRVLADASGSAGFALAGEGPTARVDLIAPELTSASGARFIGSADSRIGYLYGADEPAVIATGRWSIGGGDLPSGTLSIARHADGRVSKEERRVGEEWVMKVVFSVVRVGLKKKKNRHVD